MLHWAGLNKERQVWYQNIPSDFLYKIWQDQTFSAIADKSWRRDWSNLTKVWLDAEKVIRTLFVVCHLETEIQNNININHRQHKEEENLTQPNEY